MVTFQKRPKLERGGGDAQNRGKQKASETFGAFFGFSVSLAWRFPRFYASPPSPLEFGAFLGTVNLSIQSIQSHQSNTINLIQSIQPIQPIQSHQSNQSNSINPINPTNPIQSHPIPPIHSNQSNRIQSNPIESMQSNPIQIKSN